MRDKPFRKHCDPSCCCMPTKSPVHIIAFVFNQTELILAPNQIEYRKYNHITILELLNQPSKMRMMRSNWWPPQTPRYNISVVFQEFNWVLIMPTGIKFLSRTIDSLNNFKFFIYTNCIDGWGPSLWNATTAVWIKINLILIWFEKYRFRVKPLIFEKKSCSSDDPSPHATAR